MKASEIKGWHIGAVGFSSTQCLVYKTLVEMNRKNKKPVLNSELFCKELGIDRYCVFGAISKLIKKGLIRRINKGAFGFKEGGYVAFTTDEELYSFAVWCISPETRANPFDLLEAKYANVELN